jgi:chromosome segregation ATPase
MDNDDDSLFDTEDEVQIVESGTDDSTKESAPPESIKETKGKGDENGGGDENFRRSKKYLKCKGMLRKLQHESKLLQSQYQEKNDHFQQLQSKVQTHEQKLRELQVKVDQLEQVQKSNQLTMDGISYEMIQLKRDFQNLKNKAKAFEEQSKQKDIQMSELKQRFDQRIKDLQKKQENMKEIQHILTERPKLVEEVRSLKEKLRRVQQRQQESFPAHVEGRETTHTRKEITLPKKHGIDNASHKQRKRMLLAIREELEETENTSHFRKQRTAQEMQRIDEPNSSALPATSHAKTLVTELLKRPSKAPSQVGNQRTLVSQVTHRSENQITSLLAMKPPHMLANLPSAPRNIAPPPQSKEVSARPTATHRKQATLLQFSKHFDKPY